MKMMIDSMQIENFKGIKQLEVEFGDVTKIAGMNATGKSSIPDAFMWVLFNKDAAGNAPGSDSFREKPLDGEGHEIHNLETMVELSCRLDSVPFVLKRVQRENWVRQRGREQQEFKGNSSFYWVNDVEVSAADFKKRIASIVSDEVFRMIAMLSAFNACEWKKRRSILLSISGGDADAALLNSEKFAQIKAEIEKRNIAVDDLRKVLMDSRKMLNQELQVLPARVDEVKRMMPEIGEHEISDAEYIVKDSEADIAKIEAMIAQEKAGSGDNGKRERLLSLEEELVSIKRRALDEFNARCDGALEEKRRAFVRVTRCKDESEHIEKALAAAVSSKEASEKERDALRVSYSEAFEQKYQGDDEIESVCPACGQELPAEKVEAAREKHREDFEESKKSRLNMIREKGKRAAAAVELEAKRVVELEENRAKALEDMNEAKIAFDEASKVVGELPSEADFRAIKRYGEVFAEIDSLKDGMEKEPEEKIKGLQGRIDDLRKIVARNREVLAKKQSYDAMQERLASLLERQKDIGSQFSEVEKIIMLAEEFVKDRCAALEDGINEKFPTVRWKLFDKQINGGIADCCMCMIFNAENGALVPYDGANTAAKVNADIEIINVLSEHFGVWVPVFIDNCERVNYIAPVAGQLITLSVSTDDRLRIEILNREAA